VNTVNASNTQAVSAQDLNEEGINLAEITAALKPHWKKVLGLSLGAGILTYAGTYLIPPTYTAQTTFISPQQQQNSAAAALASLGALGGLAGLSGAVKNPADQYIALMQSVTVSDHIIDRFKLMDAYKAKFKVDARKELASNVRISAGKKDSLITVEVDDHSPQQAADMANAYVQELKQLSNGLALSEAQQRRMFFEQQLRQTRDNLASAQLAVQKAGVNQGSIKTEPKAAVESYAKVKAEIAGGEVRLRTLRNTLTENAPEIQQQLATLNALRDQLSRIEQPEANPGSVDYINAYRDFKYQEALFEIFAKQFEVAKLDESREGTLLQVVDAGTPPERRSKPKRGTTALAATLLAGFISSSLFTIRQLRQAKQPN